MAGLSMNEVLLQKIKTFCEINEQFNVFYKKISNNGKLTQDEKLNLFLYYIARDILPNPQLFQNVLKHFSEFMPNLISTGILNNATTCTDEQHKRNCILLGKLVHSRQDLGWYACKYFESSLSPFSEPKHSIKKIKMSYSEINELELVESCFLLLKSNPKFYMKKWNWSTFVQKYLNHDLKEIQWLACHCIAIITSMNEKELLSLINEKLSQTEHEIFACKYAKSQTLTDIQSSKQTFDRNPYIVINKTKINEIVEISGIYIPIHKTTNPTKDDLVIVESTYNNLRKIALGLTKNKAICLQGPVGSGKTVLVEHIAKKTGRTLGEDFIKVQLGDQTDSKMLLGTYRCTDIPGEFVWQLGVVTQAVIEGHWLLLEDIDSASVDIASVLSSLLENDSLTVPGYRDALPIKPGFQLFFTQRFISTITGDHKKHTPSTQLLEKHLLQINIDPLTTSELHQILVKLHPQFTTIADRMLSVFHLFSSKFSNSNELSIPKTSRLISTRDFFKWCSRAAIDFDVKSQSSALKVLQDAIDVFCCSYPKEEDALSLAKEISTHLGIINQKAEFFFKSYKPNMSLTADCLVVGRASVKRDVEALVSRQKFYFTRPSSVLLERVMCCVHLNEPVLLVGETGTGKTSSIQFLANTIGQKLIVINMNQQSDSADLLGGYKPVDLKFIVNPIRAEFEHLFGEFFQLAPNKTFLGHVSYCFNENRWSDLVKLMQKPTDTALKALQTNESNKSKFESWTKFNNKLNKLHLQLKQKAALAFAFIEGSLVKAVEAGYWVLLDEINLANAETLECLSGLLEGTSGSLCLLERGDKKPVTRNSNFKLFACMNPSTDVGKKDLPAGLRNRFTEFYVDELTQKNDLLLLVSSYLNALSLKDEDLSKIVDFYLKVIKETETSLTDGLGHRPHFSLRSLCRALMIAARNPCGNFKKSLYEAFSLSFLTQLDAASYKLVEKMIAKYLINDDNLLKSVLKQTIPEPKTEGKYLQFEGYWVRQGHLNVSTPENYILTDSVRRNLKDLVRIVSIGSLPVLLQGDTSVGKTSLITFLAKSSGNKCVRINNHEHTDLQEYIGSYIADSTGKLVFREGLLVEAMRKGHWIILDELNLAPTDVLEALNRVLDDNRELFIPETQETVKASSNFMLFATQNPPGSYGGRKMLSRAFRNRFAELHFNEIPPLELQFILHRRCEMPASYAGKMIKIMTDLQMRRRGSAAFAGKAGFITLRDLFRWGERYRLAQNTEKLYDWDQHLADEGYLVLAGRVRRQEEKNQIVEVLEKNLKRKVDPFNLFTLNAKTSNVTRKILEKIENTKAKFDNIVWTYNMRQLAVLVAKAFHFKEPVLLVGETGGGKTTICQLIAEQNGQALQTVNCHMHTESSDFIGGLRPVRDHSEDCNKLFEWVDGPLITAMTQGDVFLADEISLADDSVLERLNSLLEPERSLLLAEKGSDNTELVVAKSNFYFIGTMNPGGDFGKKELSPALRNRFTEIWCESCSNRDDLVAIIERNLQSQVTFGSYKGVGNAMMDFVDWFQKTDIGKRLTVSIRDILTWVKFINATSDNIKMYEAYLHGAALTFLDGLGSGVTGTENLKTLNLFRTQAQKFLKQQTGGVVIENIDLIQDEKRFGIIPFFIKLGTADKLKPSFFFNAPTTIFNTLRLLRGLQLNKAILLEGSPGVGKTSLVTALAKATRNKFFRVNLSDQTDISDLFGADLPVEDGTGGQFSWRDGPLLQALKQGYWILLDELNLASQSVLEGLNACLDHRGEIFIPELGKTFNVQPGTRFFACQNPLKQGGSRRGLPKSFLNRFIQVYINSLTRNDYFLILRHQFPELDEKDLEKMLEFNERITEELDEHRFGHKGAPWEFNLRDLTRWCEVMIYHYKDECNEMGKGEYRPENFVQLIYGDRMRTVHDREVIEGVFVKVFKKTISGNAVVFYCNEDDVCIGDVKLRREKNGNGNNGGFVLRGQLGMLRSLAYCVNLNWMSLLVGGSASGKSSIVRVLANLAGKTLKTLPVTSAMDTTDILGGFEQTDYARHLDEMVKETERILFATIRKKLVKDATGCELLQLWEMYFKVDDEVDTTRTMEAEAALFIKKLDQLQAIWLVLPCSKLIEKLNEKCEKIRKSVRKENSLNAGGRFEWVDSVLIKCLQDGCWLLVDNVNLCSAAVLDRLNALLEPQGVLTVGERGVDSNGQMIEIRPHSEFRLFLTMDPKNGEISRAMRNRGIEIYLLNEKESQEKQVFDVKTLISREGFENGSCIEVLLKLHYFVGDLILGEKPNISELLRAAALIGQQIKYGIDKEAAFVSTLVEVYFKTRSPMEFNCNDFCGMVKGEVIKLFDQKLNETFEPRVTIDTTKLSICSSLELIKQQASGLNFSPVKLSEDVTFSWIHFYTFSSNNDLSLRHAFVNSHITSADLRVFISSLFNYLTGVLVTPKNYPLDWRWIPETSFARKEQFSGNLTVLGLYLVALLTKEKSEEREKDKQVSLRHYLRLRRSKQVDDQFDQDLIIEKLLELIEEFNNYLLEAVKSQVEVKNEVVVEVLGLLTWRFAFYRYTLINIKKINTNQRHIILTSLKVHYRWFLKYSLNAVSKLLKFQLPTKLQGLINNINKSLENQFSLLHKFSKNYQKFNMKPPPKVSHNEIEMAKKVNETLKRFNVCDRGNDQLVVYTTLKQKPELKEEIIQGKISGECLKSFDDQLVGSDVTLSKYEREVVPFVDYFVRAQTWNCILLGKRVISELVLPLDLIAVLKQYEEERDERLVHELCTNFIGYLLNSISVKSVTFSQSQQNLVGCHPTLLFHLTNLLIGTEAITTFSNFHQVAKQHRLISLTLWRNCQQLHTANNDFIHNESEFILARAIDFTKALTLSLQLVYEGDWKKSLRACLTKLSILESDKDFGKSFLLHLRNVSKDTKETNCLDDEILRVSELHIELSYAKAILDSRLPLIDPSAKKALKKHYCEENINSFGYCRDSFANFNNILTGGNCKALHGYHAPLNRMINQLREKNEKLGAYVAVRPTDLLYDDVVRSVNHAFRTILAPEYIDKLVYMLGISIRQLQNYDSGKVLKDYRLVLRQYEGSVSSYENLICEWIRYRTSFPDVIEPLLADVSQFLYGLQLHLALLRKLLLKCEFKVDVQEELMALVQIPSLDQLHHNYPIMSYTSEKFSNFVKKCLRDNPDSGKQQVLSLHKAGIAESFNSCVINAKTVGTLYDNVFEQFAGLIRAFVNSWNRQEKEREEKEKEADALYKTKTKCEEKSEEDQIADELKQLFPNYHEQDFADIEKDEDKVATSSDSFSGLITHNDIKFVVDLHQTLVESFTRTEWLNPEKNKNATPNFINPLIEKYNVFKNIFDATIHSLDYQLDRDLIDSLLILLAFVQNNQIELVTDSPTIYKPRKRYDFYKDPNVEEIKSSKYILENLSKRISELLTEWPDQPTLISIEKIIERIFAFEISSPITRFLTGFEILLAKCHEWEEVAHSGVSISEFSTNLIHQIIAWRKMELNVWRDLLNSTFIRMNEPIYKWWLFLYNVMEEFTADMKINELELIETLQNYVTKSNLAEFEARLKLLYVFHCHSTLLPHNDKTNNFIRILWNVYCYFEQFIIGVQTKIKDLRTPIEKKLRDYVKIVRWKDINYWSIKETVDKSHKTLHRYVREFQDCLRQPVLNCLINTPNPARIEANIGIWDRPQRGEVKTYHYTLDPTTYLSKDVTLKKFSPKKEHSKLFERVNNNFNETRKLCNELLIGMKYPKLVQNLDGFVIEIIETSSHLQGLEVDTTLEKTKQKSQAKSIQHQKHRALADLFKSLTKIGLSYQSGLVEAKLKMGTEDFLMKPIDLGANFSHIGCKRKDEKILTIWESCEMYYHKSLMRADVLDTALKTPAPDLGLQNISRCRGFSSNLLTLIQKQKINLKETSSVFYQLRHYTTQITRLVEAKNFISIETVNKIEKFIKNLTIVTNQSLIVLNTAPLEEVIGCERLEIVILEPERNFIKTKYDELWTKASNLLLDLQALINKVIIDVIKAKGDLPSHEHDIVSLQFIPINDMVMFKGKLNEVHEKINELVLIFGCLKVAQSFSWLSSELSEIKTLIHFKNENTNICLDPQTQSIVKSISKTVLSVTQNLHKQSENQVETKEEPNRILEEKLLKELIVNNLETNLSSLKSRKLLKLTKGLCEIFFKITPSQIQEAQTIVSFILPLLEQAILFHQYFLTQQVSAYRVSCKLSSILLNIFIELASKGFCVPPEFDDGEGEGLGKPSDGLGLGDGKGERDVSDRIESEDQLDDAQPAGEEKKQEDDPDCKPEEKGIEMSEDFDSKLQDMKKKDEESSDEESDDSDADEQMGDTEKNADKKDKENFGSDQEEGEEEESDRKEEKGEGGEKENEEISAKDQEQSKEEKDDKDAKKERKEKEKEINEMEEQEFDEEQTDPYHGNQPDFPEPEPMDLPDDLQLDEGEENEQNEEEDGENPFDLDTMKEDNTVEDKDEKNKENEEGDNDEEKDFSSDDEDIDKQKRNSEKPDEMEDQEGNKEKDGEDAEGDLEEEQEKADDSVFDQTQTNEDNVEAMDVDQTTASDKTQPSQAQNQQSNQANEDLCQEDKPDKEGVGQSQMEESLSGHSVKTTASQQMQSSKQQFEENNRPQKPGESDSKRSLGNVNESVKKKLKTMDVDKTDSKEMLDEERDDEAEMFKHIKDANESSSAQVLDVATKEQAEEQEVPNLNDEDKCEEATESKDQIPDEKEENLKTTDAPFQKSETITKSKKEKKSHPDGEILEDIESIEVDGDLVQTMQVQRGSDTTYHTLFEELRHNSATRLTIDEMSNLRQDVEKQLASWSEVPTDAEADRTWQKISSVTSSLAQDLSEQLRLVLEPTQASRLKGDFKTGRRINMRKVIPYIASQFRKDKIWLRRTKPSKREYQIVLAIDDSSSMADNHSKELAFESVALISKALSLLESGQLSVLSFGESTTILHKLTDQFTDQSGIKLLQKFKFDQNKTCVAKLVDFVSEMLVQSQMQSSALNAKLLVIVSDGRGVFSEGETFVRQAVRRAKLSNIFMVFVIVDNPANNHSILDIRMPCFKDGKLLGIENYMDSFPFAFYIILKDINALPSVLSDALRQWFEVVSNLDKH